VLYGEWYRDNWQEWINENSEYIDFFYLNRPHITIKYIDTIKELTRAKVFFYGHDLHFLREQKQYEIEKTPELLQSIEDWKKLETELFKKSDVVLTCSGDEKEVIEKETHNKNVHVIPAYCYSQFNEPVSNFQERKDLLFVGGFDHKPNVDAVLWFTKEVMPLISEKIPDIKFTIAGSNPPAEVTGLASNNIEVSGYLPYEELNNLYKKAKLVVIPLRYGAGVKGKTVEAMYHGVPFVTTQFGIEGLQGINNLVTSRNTAEDFANGVIELYNNNNALTDFSKKSVEYVSQNFSEPNLKNTIKTLFS
jgi:glycosyltransferase involved in cell wall biosynthesis